MSIICIAAGKPGETSALFGSVVLLVGDAKNGKVTLLKVIVEVL
jgi:tRNA A37 threonylcarbamoyladenosine biosynthesis protein TsaE